MDSEFERRLRSATLEAIYNEEANNFDRGCDIFKVLVKTMRVAKNNPYLEMPWLTALIENQLDNTDNIVECYRYFCNGLGLKLTKRFVVPLINSSIETASRRIKNCGCNGCNEEAEIYREEMIGMVNLLSDLIPE